MKKLSIIIILFAALMLQTMSCSRDFLETAPTNSANVDDFKASFEGARMLLVGVNRTRFINNTPIATATVSFGEGAIIDLLEGLSDDFFESPVGVTAASRWLEEMSLHSEMVGSSAAAIPWNMLYEMISPLNQLLALVDEVQNSTEAQRNWLTAQALAYRAHFFHLLVRIYGPAYHHSPDELGIVLALEHSTQGIARSTVRESYAQIREDLHEALRLMGEPGVSAIAAAHDRTFISLRVMHGVLSRVYLDMHNWTEAARFANLAGTGVPLMTRPQFMEGFYIVNPEWMWASFVPGDEGTMFHSQPSMRTHVPGMYPGAWGFTHNISQILVDHTDSARDVRIGGLTDTLTPSLMIHFRNEPLSYNKFRWTAAGDPYNILYMRGAEMMLNEAEALLMANTDIARARTLVQELINARIDDDGEFAATLDAMDRDELLAELKMQRRLEFWGEGIRWFDLKRRGETVDRRGSGVNLAGVHPMTQVISNPQSRWWTFRIPEREVRVNPIVVQNPDLPW